MKVLGIIPSRFASTRFPGKPLVDIAGKSMIQRVYEQCKKSTVLSDVIVATDDDRILEHIKSFGGKAILTSIEHKSGTDRCAEVVESDFINKWNVVVNIQGDEPFINPEQIDQVVEAFKKEDTQITTLIKRINDPEELFNTNIPKVTVNSFDEAIYFSRQTIPFQQGKEKTDWLNYFTYYKHIGIYAYRTGVLKKITELEPSTLEKAESLEQLRWIENGFKIKALVTEYQSAAIDTPEDLDKLLKSL